MLFVDLRKNSDYFSIQHRLTGFYNRDRECLLRGTDWVFSQASSCLEIGFPLSVSFSSILYNHLQLHAVLTSNTNGRSLGTSHRAMFCRKQASIGVETIFTFIVYPENFIRKRKKRGLEGLSPLEHGRPIFFWQRTKTVIAADWLAARAWIKMRGIHHRLHYRAVFVV